MKKHSTCKTHTYPAMANSFVHTPEYPYTLVNVVSNRLEAYYHTSSPMMKIETGASYIHLPYTALSKG